MISFTCAVCQKAHPALPPEEPPERDREKLAALKATWDLAERRILSNRSPRASVPLNDCPYLLGKLALSWRAVAEGHVRNGRSEQARACLETAARHWERRKLLGTKQERDRREAASERASMAYLIAARRTGVWRVPASLVTDNDGTLFLRCTEPCTNTRHDGLRRGQGFFVIQLFDKDGYYCSVKAPTEQGVREKASTRSASKGFIAASMPFRGGWVGGSTEVSVPPEFKGALTSLDHGCTDA